MPLRRVVLSGEDHIPTLKVLLGSLTSEPQQAYNEFMGVLVEAIRYRDRAITEIVMMLKNLDMNLKKQYYVQSLPIVNVVRDLALSLARQVEECQLYNKRGVLMYVYFRHPDFCFDDVILTEIIALKWNGEYHEPRQY